MKAGVKATRGDFSDAPSTEALHSICKQRHKKKRKAECGSRSGGSSLNCSNTGNVLKSKAGLGPVGAHAVIEHRLPCNSRQPDARTKNLACIWKFYKQNEMSAIHKLPPPSPLLPSISMRFWAATSLDASDIVGVQV